MVHARYTEPPRPSELPIHTIIRAHDDQLYIRVDSYAWTNMYRSVELTQDMADEQLYPYGIVSVPAFFDKMLRKRQSHATRMRLSVNKEDMKKPSELPIYTVILSDEVGEYIRRDADSWISLHWLKCPDVMTLQDADREFGDYAILAQPKKR